MKCPTCGAHSYVLETRLPRRKRECANGHKFWTQEVLEGTHGTEQPERRKAPRFTDPWIIERNKQIVRAYAKLKDYRKVGRMFALSDTAITTIILKAKLDELEPK